MGRDGAGRDVTQPDAQDTLYNLVSVANMELKLVPHSFKMGNIYLVGKWCDKNLFICIQISIFHREFVFFSAQTVREQRAFCMRSVFACC